MAEVFLAVVRGPAGFNKLVVIKQIRPQLAEDPEFLGMFLDEARLAARLSHPNVVQTNEVGQEGERYFIAMEYLEGQPLNRILHRLSRPAPSLFAAPSADREAITMTEPPGPPGQPAAKVAPGLPLAMHLRILSDVLAGLQHAHELTDYDGTPLGVVHRDVTPHNVFITYDGQVKVVDFGIAKALNSSSETRTGVLKGKVAYMAPEQAQGERVDRRADVFAVGVLLWEAATSRRLWKGVPDITILQRLLAGDIPQAREIKPEIPDTLNKIIAKAMAHRRDDRYATALELQIDLDSYIDTMGGRVTAREIGKVISAAFQADRTKIKSIIEEQIRFQGGPVKPLVLTESSHTLPRIDPTTRATGSHVSLTGMERYGLENSLPRVEATRTGPASYTHPSMFTSSAALSEEAAGRPRRRSIVAAGALALGALASAGGIWWLAVNRVPAAPARPAVSATATASAAVPAQIDINISALPPEAKIFLDDKPVGNPYRSKLPRDKATHQIRIEAKGFLPVTTPVSLEDNVYMSLALQKDTSAVEKAERSEKSEKSERSERRYTPPPARQPPPPPPEDSKRTGGKRRTIDTNNPYGQ
jgi:serine/threonine-protein kinase